MSIPLADNFNYLGTKPDFARQQYPTLEAMRNVLDSRMPSLYLAYCLEDENVYLYNKNNVKNEVTGRFRVFTPPSSDSIQKNTMPPPGQSVIGKIYQYVGPTTESFKKGQFYLCSYNSVDEYIWEQIPTMDIANISAEEIEALFPNNG